MAALRSPGFVRAEHPALGPVVFTPGELLPPWVAEAIGGGARLVAVPEEEGVMVLELPAKAKAAAKAAGKDER